LEEKTYAIYRFLSKWDQPDYEGNLGAAYKMYAVDPTQEEIEKDLQHYKEDTEKRHEVIRWHELKSEYVEHETWMVRWFCHITFNRFETDDAAIASFRKFVERKMEQNIRNGHHNVERSNSSNAPFYCFMGAEDEWRWEVCHCEECQKSGMTIISH
jgi:hypothetical protein